MDQIGRWGMAPGQGRASRATGGRGPGTEARAWPGARRCAAAALLGLGLAGPAAAQVSGVAADNTRVRTLNENVAYSLFLLTNGGFTSAGYIDYRDDTLTAKINVYTLPLRLPLQTGLLGPIELRLTTGYSEAKTTSQQVLPGLGGVTEREYVSLLNFRLDLGRPITLLPDLVATPMVGIGTQHWSGKLDRNPLGGSAVPADRTTFWTDALLAELAMIVEYRYRWGAVNIRPGASASFINLSTLDGRATITPMAPDPPARGKATVDADSTILRAALRADGPLGYRLGEAELRWQSFVVGNYSTSAIGLFPWSIELGVAAGVELGAVGRRLVGFDPGALYLGASYITGANFSGVRANFGFRF
ncbi:MAG: hypothetical protein AAGC69_19185 [Paracraurococcus sp.]|jgi:hypothetical protein